MAATTRALDNGPNRCGELCVPTEKGAVSGRKMTSFHLAVFLWCSVRTRRYTGQLRSSCRGYDPGSVLTWATQLLCCLR